MKTDWNLYYATPATTASITRKVTTKKLLNCFRYFDGNLRDAKLAEFGGANSCFFTAIDHSIAPKEYWIVDSNEAGLRLFTRNFPKAAHTRLFMDDVLAFSGFNALADIAFSVGLIEHFSPSDTKRAIQTHFDSVRSGGLVIVTFPTPTLLYRTTRRTIELLGQWKFHDERPLSFTEVLPTMERYGTILHTEINWPIFLTQGIVVARKK